MTTSDSDNCYDQPRYWDLAFDDETQEEADFIEAAARKYCAFTLQRVLEPGCGGGRQLLEMARRGCHVLGYDISAEAVRYACRRLSDGGYAGEVTVADMTRFCSAEPVDVAYCFVNTFRHLLTEQDAVAHLHCVADSLRPGGLYLLGMHLLPPDADEEDEETWSAEAGEVRVDMHLDVAAFDRAARLETLRFQMTVNDNGTRREFVSDYQMRIYRADQFQSLLTQVPDLQLLDVYDFCYDISEPLKLSDELGDTVFVLQRPP